MEMLNLKIVWVKCTVIALYIVLVWQRKIYLLFRAECLFCPIAIVLLLFLFLKLSLTIDRCDCDTMYHQ